MKTPRLIACLALAWLLPACGSNPNPGVEVGNPKLGGQVVTITPLDREDVYVVRFLADGSAGVTQVVDQTFESVDGTVSSAGDDVSVAAQFSSGPDFQAEFEVSEAGEILDVSLLLDGVPVESTFTVEFAKPSLKALWSNDALLAVATICRRVSECRPTTPAEACETDLREVPGLAQSFGGSPGQNMGQMAQSVDAGAVGSDPEALNACLSDIEILPCSRVEQSHEPGSPGEYHQAHRLVPKPSCAQAFSQKN